MKPQTAFILLLSCSGNLSFAQAIKCVDANGKVTYTNQGCPDTAKKKTEISITDNTADFSGYRRQAQQAGRAPPQPGSSVTSNAVGIGVESKCEQAKKNLQTASGGIRPSSTAIAKAQQEVLERCNSAPARASCYQSIISSPTPFLGNHGEIVEMQDGTMWSVDDYDYKYLYAYHPTVRICPSKGFLVLDRIKIQIAPL